MQLQQIVYSVVVFCFGAALGSFLNVVVYRLPRGKSLIWPPSHCPKCYHELSMASENVPIIGWFMVRGKCRYCGEPLSFRYPLVEFLTACLVLASYLYLVRYHGRPLGQFIVWTGLALALVACALTDLSGWMVPDVITKPGLALAPVACLLVPTMMPPIHSALEWPEHQRLQALAGCAVGMAVGAGFLYLAGILGKRIFGREAMGLGDVKLLGMVGGYLGWQGFLYTFIIGSMVALALTLIGTVGKLEMLRSQRGEVKYVPGLALGAIAFMVWQEPLVNQLVQFSSAFRWVVWPD